MIDEKVLSTLLSDNVKIRRVEPHIYSLYPEGENSNSYDKMGTLYDLVLCNRFYNRFVWGYGIEDYEPLMLEVLETADGWILDAGCGSLAFTAKTYANYVNRPTILLDQSVKLLRMAKARIIKLKGSVPENMLFLHGSVLDLPFTPKTFHTIISLNILHVFVSENLKRMLSELKNALDENGSMVFTTMVENNRLADKYLHLLRKTGELYPRNMSQLASCFDESGIPIRHQIRGSMAFIYSA